MIDCSYRREYVTSLLDEEMQVTAFKWQGFNIWLRVWALFLGSVIGAITTSHLSGSLAIERIAVITEQPTHAGFCFGRIEEEGPTSRKTLKRSSDYGKVIYHEQDVSKPQP